MAAVDLLAADKFPRTAVRLAENHRQRNTLQSVFVFQLITVQELHRHPKPGDKLLPFIAHAEGGMRDRAQIAGIGLRRDDLVADVEQRVHETAIGVVDED